MGRVPDWYRMNLTNTMNQVMLSPWLVTVITLVMVFRQVMYNTLGQVYNKNRFSKAGTSMLGALQTVPFQQNASAGSRKRKLSDLPLSRHRPPARVSSLSKSLYNPQPPKSRSFPTSQLWEGTQNDFRSQLYSAQMKMQKSGRSDDRIQAKPSDLFTFRMGTLNSKRNSM